MANAMSNASVHIPSSRAEERRGIGSRLGRSGMVEAPDGIASLPLGSFGIPTALTEVNNGGSQEDGPAGGSERRVNDQRFFTDPSPSFVVSVWQNQAAPAEREARG